MNPLDKESETALRKVLKEHEGLNRWWEGLSLVEKRKLNEVSRDRVASSDIPKTEAEQHEAGQSRISLPDPYPMEAGLGIR